MRRKPPHTWVEGVGDAEIVTDDVDDFEIDTEVVGDTDALTLLESDTDGDTVGVDVTEIVRVDDELGLFEGDGDGLKMPYNNPPDVPTYAVPSLPNATPPATIEPTFVLQYNIPSDPRTRDTTPSVPPTNTAPLLSIAALPVTANANDTLHTNAPVVLFNP